MKKFFPLILIFLVVLILYYPALSVFFSQDDFFHIKIAQTDGSVLGFVRLFGFYPFEERGIAFYRPVFREALFNILYSLFSLAYLPYRIFAFAIHFMNIALVYIFFQRLFDQKLLSLFVAFFFGVTAANVATLYYFTGGIQTLGATMFMLLSLIFFWDFLLSGKTAKKIASFIFFILAFTSHELAAVNLSLLSGLVFLKTKSLQKTIVQGFKQLWLPSLLLVLILSLEFLVIGFSKSEVQYQPILSIKAFANTLAWYAAWSLGLPEMTIDFVQPGLKLAPQLMRYWGDYFKIIFPAFFLSIGVLVIAFSYLVFRKRKVFKDKRFWFLATWFPFALLPVVFLPWHKSTYYLVPALPAFWGVIGFILFKTNSKILLSLFIVSAFLLSFVSVKLGETTYWAATRGRIAQKLLQTVHYKYPVLPSGAAIYFLNDPDYPFVAKDWGGTSKQASLVLNGSDALQLWYKDPSLKVYYEDFGGIPSDIPQDKVYSLVAYLR